MRYAILVLASLIALLAACGGDGEEAAPTPAATTAPAETQPPSAPAEQAPTGGTLAFTSCIDVDDEGHFSCDIYVVKADGSGLTRAVDDGRWPVWSPDGSHFAFLGEDEQVSVVNADGTGIVRLAESGDPISPPAWSPDGTQIAFVRGQDNLGVVAADGSGPPTFFENPEFDYYSTPAWSPGRRIVFQFITQAPLGLGTQLYLIDPDGSNLTQLTDMDPDPFFPTWSPDGSRIVFAAEGDIYVVNPDGSDLTNLTSGPSEDNYPVWSPDGSRIAFSSCGAPCVPYVVNVVNADGSGLTRIAEGPAFEEVLAVAWSPGARIAFPSCNRVEETSTCAVYIVNADGSGLTRIAEAPAGEEVLTVAWSPAQ